MDNSIIIFNNQEFGNVRTVVIDGEPWFVGKDVAESLGYSNTRDAIGKYVDEDDKADVAIHDGRQNRNMTVVNESGIYALIFGSKLKSAKKFKHWITHDVIPTLRKTGTYSIDTKPDSYMIEDPAARARRWAEEYEEKQLVMQENEKLVERNDELQSENDEMRPKAKFHDDIAAAKNSLLLGEFAGIIQNNHNIKLGEKKLFEWCRNKGFLCSSLGYWNKPTQRMITSGYMQVCEHTHIAGNGQKYVSYSPLLTGKGQIWLTDQLMKEFGN